MPVFEQSKTFYSVVILLLVFSGVFLFSIQPYTVAPERNAKDIKTAALAMSKIRKKVKSAIKSPEDPQARYNFEFNRLRDPRTGKIPVNIRQKELAFSATLPTAEVINFNKSGRNARGMATGWENRGPFNVGGRTRALAIDVANENTILAGGVSGGMWRSTNSGLSWSKTTDPALLQSVTTVSQDIRPGKTNTWYYGTGELVGGSASAVGALYRGNGIYKSTNNGISWTVLPATFTSDVTTLNTVFQWVWRVATNPANANQDEVLAATIGGIQRSVNGGQTWTNALGTIVAGQTTNQARYTDIAISPGGVMYATLSQASSSTGSAPVRGIYRSTDGVNWINITPANWPTVYERIVLDISPSNENIVYFLANTPGAGKFDTSLWKYTYGSGNGAGTGSTWENRSANIPGFGGEVGDYNHQENYNMMVEVKPDDPNQVFIGGTNLYWSSTGFATATNTRWIGGYTLQNNAGKYPNHHPDQHALAFYPSNSRRVISAHDGGLSRTENLVSADTVRWTSLNRGYLTTQFTSVAIDLDNTDDLVLGGMQDNGTWATYSSEPTANWFSLLSGDGAFGAAVANSIIVSAQNGFIYRYAFNNAGSNTGYARIDPRGGGGYLFVNPYAIDPNNQYVMYLPAGDTLWRNNNLNAIPVGQGEAFSEQNTTNWRVISTINTNDNITAVAVSKTPANTVYFGTARGEIYKIQNALSSNNPVRVNVTGTNFPASGISYPYVNCIAVDPNNADRVVVAFSNYGIISLYQTTNGGLSWTPVAGNLEENLDGSGNGPSVKWVSMLPAGNGGEYKYFVGTSTGLYATANLNGTATTWVKEGAATIGNVPVDMVISRPTDNLVVVGTHGNGVYSYYYNEPLAVPDTELPATFQVKQNYPNPFSNSTTISYDLVKAGQVIVKIYDLTGREITTLVNDRQLAGTHQVLWNGRHRDGSRLANGIYLYRVQVDKEQVTKQMLLQR